MNRCSDEMIARIREVRRTHSLAETRDICGVTTNTIVTYARDVVREACGCGRPGGHRGWCTVLYAKHPGRRAVVQAMAANINAKWTDAAREIVRARWIAGVDETDIAAEVNALLDRTDITVHAVQVQAGKLKAKRPRGYLSAMRSRMRLRYFHGDDHGKWEAALARKAHIEAHRGTRTWSIPAKISREDAAAIWANPALGCAEVQELAGVTYQSLRTWFGPRKPFILAALVRAQDVAVDVHQEIHRTPPAAAVPRMPVEAPAVTPMSTILASPRRGFSMMAMRIRDPLVDLRLRQAAEASKGRLNPVMGTTLVPA